MKLETLKGIVDAKLPPGFKSGIGGGRFPGEDVLFVTGNGKSIGIRLNGANPIPLATEEEQKEAAEKIACALIDSIKAV